MIKDTAFALFAMMLAAPPANAVSMARDIYPLQKETQDLRKELEQLRNEVLALKQRAIRLTLDCTFACKSAEPKEFDSLKACRDSFPSGYKVTSTCITFMGRANGVPEN